MASKINLSPLPSDAVHSKAIVLLLFSHGLLLFPLSGGCVWSMFCYAVLCVLSSFAFILLGKRELVALLLWDSECQVSVIVLYLFFKVPWVGL